MVIGDRAGTGTGNPGDGSGGFSSNPDLQGSVLVRKSHSEYPASQGRPATVHDDLMVTQSKNIRALFTLIVKGM